MKVPHRGRGATFNPANRYNEYHSEAIDDGWETPPDDAPHTTVEVEDPRTIISRNDSPDVPFDRSVNAYRGCEHGCIYCFARPTHAWLGLSPGLDFETRLTAKPGAAALLRGELGKPDYHPAPLALGTNTDPYQPIERQWEITREILEVLHAHRHPVTITTKSALIERDLDILAEMARTGLAQVQISLATLQPELARRLEPRAASPKRRLQLIENLVRAGIPTAALAAPVIPVLTDPELEKVLAATAKAGATAAAYILLRLPMEVAPLFEQWLHCHYPLKAEHVLNRIRDCRRGALNTPTFGERMSGNGEYAGMIAQRFRLATKRLGLKEKLPPLDCSRFRRSNRQFDLFD